jgi:putative ABC transport system permease protein
VAALVRFVPALANTTTTAPDGAVLAAAIVLAAASAVIFSVAPAWRASAGATRRLSLRGASSDPGISRVRIVLVTVQIALAIMLVIGATVLLSSLVRILQVDPGFDPGGVATFSVTLPEGRYADYEQRAVFFQQVFEQLSALPGVISVCAINEVPFDSQGRLTYVPEGQSRLIGAQPRTITPSCVDVLRLRLLTGRSLTGAEPGRVALVSRLFARSAWPDQDPVGRRLHVGTRDGALIDIVGVVDDALQGAPDEARLPQVYELMGADTPFEPSRVLLRTVVPLDRIAPRIRDAVRRIDPLQPVAGLRTLDDLRSASLSGRRFQLGLLSAFAAAALLLAAVGIYGLLHQIVTQRSGEIAIRLALGATPSSVVQLVMRSAWLSVAAGATLGLCGAFATSMLLRRLVFGVSPTDPTLYTVATLALIVVALVAAWLPARRAAAIDAVAALRRD